MKWKFKAHKPRRTVFSKNGVEVIVYPLAKG
jgi:hypothetical protein